MTGTQAFDTPIERRDGHNIGPSRRPRQMPGEGDFHGAATIHDDAAG